MTNKNIPRFAVTFKPVQVILWLAATALLVHPGAVQAQAPVNLLSNTRFAILAASQVTDVPTSAITGDVGLSPAARSFITGLTAPEVTGSILAASDGGAVAITLTQAQSDLTTAYNDAAGRTPVPSGPFLDPGSGNLGGLTLGGGLYKFTGAALIAGSDLVLSGSPTNVWIFQIASTLTVDDGIQVTLAGGAQASNVFWQVGTSAAMGTTAVMVGTIMAHDSVTFGTGASLNGRALAETAEVTLESTTITIPSQGALPPIITGISLGGNGEATLVIYNTPNEALTIQTSTDLTNWTTLATPTPSASPYSFTDTLSTPGMMRFYRAFYP